MLPLFQGILEGRGATLDSFIEALGDRLPLLHQLRETPQDLEWHAEGDVHVHTAWVMEEAWSLLGQGEWAGLSAERRLALLIAAALHDIAKPLTTVRREVDGRERVLSPRHAIRGRSYLAPRLAGLGLPAPLLREVLALVALHHDPKLLVLKERPAGMWRALGRQVDVPLLYLLEQADMRGRSCPDKDDQIELIDLFRLGAEEHGMWGVDPWQGWREHLEDALLELAPEVRQHIIAESLQRAERGELHSPEEALAATWGLREGRGSRLTITCGPSGSGKSSWARGRYPDARLISLDGLREELTGDASDQSQNGEVVREAKERVKGVLREGGHAVLDATSLRRDGRGAFAALGTRYGAFVEIAAFLVPAATLEARNASRARRVPGAVLARQLDGWEWPAEDEAHRLLVLGDQGEELWAT